MSEWISVKDRFPADCTELLVTDGDNYYLSWYEGESFGESSGLCMLYGITHWMPLPGPPKE